MELHRLSARRPASGLIDLVARLRQLQNDPVDPADLALADERFQSSWEAAASGLLARTSLIRVTPDSLPAPRSFDFELDLPYLRQARPDGPIERSEGPLRGSIFYRPDLLTAGPDEPVVQVTLEDRGYLHPNYSRRYGFFCGGVLPPDLDLEPLLELLWAFLSYQLYTLGDPADRAAANLFSTDPHLLDGIDEVPPLY